MSREDKDTQTGSNKKQPEFDRRSYLQTVGATSAGLALGTGASSVGVQSAAASLESNDDVGFFIIDDFEDEDLSEYSFDRGSSGASITNSPTHHGENVLEISGTDTEMISTSGLDYYPTAGDTFRYWVRGHNGADRINLTYGVQDHQNRYFARVNPHQGHIALYRYENGSSTLLADEGVSLSQNTWYEAEIDWGGSGGHTLTLSDSSGTQLAQISATDSRWTSGGVGYDAYLSDGGTVYIDHVTKGTYDPSNGQLIVDNFEDNDLDEYRFDRGSSGASVVTSPTKTGSHALEIAGTSTEMISTSWLPHYPSVGSTFSYWVRGTGGADDLNLSYGVQDHTNRYFVRVDIANNDLFLFRYEDGTAYQLAEDAAVSLSQDAWYEVEVEWARDGTHTVTLFDNSGAQLSQISATDSTWSSGGIGYDAYLSSGEAVYFDGVTIDEFDESGAGILIEDFEDGDLSEYSFDRGSSGASVVSTPTFNGSYALEISGTDTEMIRKTGLPNDPEAGDRFSYWVRATGGADDINLSYGVQDHENRYFVRVDFANDNLKLYRYENGTSYLLAKKTSGFTIAEDAWNKVVIDWRRNGHQVVRLHSNEGDANGGEIMEIAATDSTWTYGGIGFDAYLSDGGTVHFDYIAKGEYESLDAGARVDDFEDAELSEYTFDQGSSGTRIISAPTYFGSHALELSETNVEMISTSGLDNYPEADDQFRAYVRATGGADKFNFAYAVQDHNNRYFVRVNFATSRLALYRYENGTGYKLAADGTSFCLSEDTWFRIEIDWRQDGTHTVSLHNDSEDQMTQISAADSTWTDGGVGYDAYLSDGGTVYLDAVLVDGLGEKINDLEESHGPIRDVTTEYLSSSGDEKAKIETTYEFDDGTTYQVTNHQTRDTKGYMTDSNDTYWSDDPPEGRNVREKNTQRLEARSKGGGE